METALKLIAGAVAGAAVGFLMARARGCSSGACVTKTNTIVSMVAWAVFAAAVTWYFVKH